jgi:Flp pilus assembly protein TadG
MLVQKFVKDCSGNITLMASLSALVLMAATGAGIDMMRWSDTKTNLAAAMDNAVLSGTQYLVEHHGANAAAIEIARSLFAAEIKDADLVSNSVDFKMNSKGNGLAAFGKAEIETSFLKVVGMDRVLVLSDSVAEAAVAEAATSAPSSDLEISVMLDVTGSMCNDGNGPCTTSTKLNALKAAATELVDTVIWDDQSTYTSKLAIVPFSTRVRVGQDGAGSAMMKKLTNLSPNFSGWRKECTSGSSTGTTSETSGTWTCNSYSTTKVTNWKLMPCVTDRFYDAGWKFELTDQAPGSGAYLNAHDGSRMVESADSSDIKATSALGKTKSDPTLNWNYSADGVCYDVAQSNEVLPLTNNKTTLKAKINGLEAYGATAGVLGTAFSWYMLSPNWKTIWTGQSQPKSYDLLTETNSQGKPKLRKIAIIMTDGSYNTMRGWKDQDVTTMSANALQMCTNMKAKGIEIYTIGFALDSLPATEISTARTTLQNCGSSIDHFYETLDASQLKNAFAEIGSNVAETQTRLTK